MDTSKHERIVAQQRRIVGLIVFVVLVVVALGVAVVAASTIGQLSEIRMSTPATTSIGVPTS